MHLNFCIQDPTLTNTTYLYEAILGAASRASTWRGLYAFASRDGIRYLLEDKIVQDLVERGGEVDLVVGLDAVTNRVTLEYLQEMEQTHANFRPKVFWNDPPHGLFHPKISDFGLPNGGRILIVGSGNLTPGGLRGNFEAYTIITTERADEIDIGALEEFLNRNADNIRYIDDEVLERAALNKPQPLKEARRAGVGRRGRVAPPGSATLSAGATVAFDRIMLAQVPRAGGRWAQVHFNAEVINTYFRINRNRLDTERVYLTHIRGDGARNELEVRPCVYSADSNKNLKIEIGAAKNLGYPDGDRPLLVFRERGLRTYDYILLMPGQDGHSALLDLSNSLPSPGQGLRRPVTNLKTLIAA